MMVYKMISIVFSLIMIFYFIFYKFLKHISCKSAVSRERKSEFFKKSILLPILGLLD